MGPAGAWEQVKAWRRQRLRPSRQAGNTSGYEVASLQDAGEVEGGLELGPVSDRDSVRVQVTQPLE